MIPKALKCPGWAVITGASSGFGEATAMALAELGFNLFLGARRLDRLEDVAARTRTAGALSAAAHRLDVASTPSVSRFADWVSSQTRSIDLLINNAGGALGLDPVRDGKDEDWEGMIQSNVLGVLRMTRAMLPLLGHRPGASIINIGSVASRTVYEGGAAYCAAKAGELQITRTLRLELCGTGIRVCTVDPGMAETEFSLVRFKGDAERAARVYEGMTPLSAQDVAEAIVWVATRPPHVCIDELTLKPTDQATVYRVHRRPPPTS